MQVSNVMAPVPDINDFTRGITAALKEGGTVTLEFPHLMRLLEFNQFDTVYHDITPNLAAQREQLAAELAKEA